MGECLIFACCSVFWILFGLDFTAEQLQEAEGSFCSKTQTRIA